MKRIDSIAFCWWSGILGLWVGFLFLSHASANVRDRFINGAIWPDDQGIHINAHGGGILYHLGRYYWFGEHKTEGRRGNQANVGVRCYSSSDLYNWKNEGVALAVSQDADSEIVAGSVIERPKVIFNFRTRKYVMWFHLELKGQGYRAARTGVAVADSITGPYRYVRSFRPNAGDWPDDFADDQKTGALPPKNVDYWSPEGLAGLRDGMVVRRDFEGGQMARDMTLFVDEDAKAYHIHASEENGTLHISELSEDYLSFTGRYVRVFPGDFNEAPALFKYKNRYWLVSSGCTGWKPNAARSAVADSIWGPWQALGNPCVGKGPEPDLGPEVTFGGQSTYALPVHGRPGAFIILFDIWRPKNAIDGRYIWLPAEFENGALKLRYRAEWDLSLFDTISPAPKDDGYRLVWSDEFDGSGPPDPANWTYERGFVRNEEAQWYQEDNAWREDGKLMIEARKERIPNPNYRAGSSSWRTNREFAEYSSSCILTRGLHEWKYGRFEMRARIDIRAGLWPAFWTLGSARRWPACGEIDIMEYYRGMVLANAAWGGGRGWQAVWDSTYTPPEALGGSDWADQFHVWRMDWDENAIRLYVDDRLLNTIDVTQTVNRDREGANPFREPHYILINLAIGGQNGGDPSKTTFPSRYEIDYVRVSQKGAP